MSAGAAGAVGLRTPRRYQLNKHALAIVRSGHPWIFRDQLSSAAAVFASGQWLRLVAGDNQVVGHGVYEADGAIAIRVLSRGAERPRAPSWRARVEAALARRAPLRAETDAWRALHGESDGLPAVVVDVFGDVVVAQSYSAGVDGLTRWAGRLVADHVGARAVVWRPARRRVGAVRSGPTGAGAAEPGRLLRGVLDGPVTVREGDRRLVVDARAGQKSGSYLDLRGLRRHVAALPLAGARVLNLFAFTGGLATAAGAAGAGEVWNVDASEAALAHAAAHHDPPGAIVRQIKADIFTWLGGLDAAESFALVIVDPPSMTSRIEQVPAVLASYRRLYQAAGRHVAAGGVLLAACCTSRVTRAQFDRAVREGLGAGFTHELDLLPELDHPATFAEARYLKIAQYRRR
ncbi:MAG: class I SAM-dependent methyltransferase [Kofleriaceae bacterium]|jgi:23S rRNA (cytosine1962-C5)-methyltransferase|nr:class I SAM-dependent methyltransferase [Kofleriaceae bacterium]MBP6840047.1 class I SAM-dependent methyltransferase [Kofleriaceae bacterium]MBP9208535.1 class I SAM-dependent methyltransferase [Kofleriaceae bacterium]